MKSQRTLDSPNLPDENNTFNICRVEIRNIRFYECTIIYLHNAQLCLKNCDGQKTIIYPQSICYIDKNTAVDMIFDNISRGSSYEIYSINNDLLNHVCEIMSLLIPSPKTINLPECNYFSFSADDTDKKVFGYLVNENTPFYRKVYKLTYLLSKCENIESLAYSLSIAKKITTTEKIKKIIESDLSKTWSINDFAERLYMSESSVRKKLEKEKTKYSHLILDIRMNYAIKSLITTEKHINTISREVGYVSTSYFIRKFKEYFGITPKKFSINIKNKP